MNPADEERFDRIQRDVGSGFATTFKDLRWLVGLVLRLDRSSVASGQLPVVSKPEKSVETVLLSEGVESVNVIRKRRAELEAVRRRSPMRKPQKPSMRPPSRRKRA